jgi:hypothetical protein
VRLYALKLMIIEVLCAVVTPIFGIYDDGMFGYGTTISVAVKNAINGENEIYIFGG